MKRLSILIIFLLTINIYSQNNRINLNLNMSKFSDTELNFLGFGLGYMVGFNKGTLHGILIEYQFAKRELEGYQYGGLVDENLNLLKIAADFRTNPSGLYVGGEFGYARLDSKYSTNGGYYFSPKGGFFDKKTKYHLELKYNLFYFGNAQNYKKPKGFELSFGIVL